MSHYLKPALPLFVERAPDSSLTKFGCKLEKFNQVLKRKFYDGGRTSIRADIPTSPNVLKGTTSLDLDTPVAKFATLRVNGKSGSKVMEERKGNKPEMVVHMHLHLGGLSRCDGTKGF